MLTSTLLLSLLALGCTGGDTTATDSGDTDADTDADTDTDTDTDTDVPIEGWEHCPDSSAYVGDGGWTGALEVTHGAMYCGGYNEVRSLEDELAYKAQLRLVTGSYLVPAAEGDHDLALAACTRVGPDSPGPAMSGVGSTTVSPNTWGGVTYSYLAGSQPFVDPLDAAFSLEHSLVLVGAEGASPDPLIADGGGPDATTGAGVTLYLYPEGGSLFDVDAVAFWSCDDDAWTPESHTVTFDGGEVTLDLELGINTVQTAPGTFARAAGTLDGQDFEITDYFQLFYRPDHHHFGRHFAVRFDAPIGDVCALRVEQVDPLEGDPTAVVSTADCDLAVIEVLDTLAETYTYGG